MLLKSGVSVSSSQSKLATLLPTLAGVPLLLAVVRLVLAGSSTFWGRGVPESKRWARVVGPGSRTGSSAVRSGVRASCGEKIMFLLIYPLAGFWWLSRRSFSSFFHCFTYGFLVASQQVNISNLVVLQSSASISRGMRLHVVAENHTQVLFTAVYLAVGSLPVKTKTYIV